MINKKKVESSHSNSFDTNYNVWRKDRMVKNGGEVMKSGINEERKARIAGGNLESKSRNDDNNNHQEQSHGTEKTMRR